MNDTPRTEWLSLMDFALLRGVSLSTLRRYIKTNKVPYRFENGKYLIPTDADVRTYRSIAQSISPFEMPHASPAEAALQQQISALREELQRAHEEIAELKTLIAYYEESTRARRVNA